MNQLLKYPGDKWWKYVALWHDSTMRAFLPETLEYGKNNLELLWNKYPVLFLKPSLGTGGKGIVMLKKTEDYTWLTHPTRARTVYSHRRGHVAERIWRSFNPRHYIVQQGIDLLSLHGRPVDFRILLLKLDGEWNVMGMMGKIAAKRKFVTNYCQGGDAVMPGEALARTGLFEPERTKQIEEALHDVALHAAHVLNAYFPNLHEIGIDAAVDEAGRIYILEANSRPHYNLFRHHDDRKLYVQIDRNVRKLRRKPAEKRRPANMLALRSIVPTHFPVIDLPLVSMHGTPYPTAPGWDIFSR